MCFIAPEGEIDRVIAVCAPASRSPVTIIPRNSYSAKYAAQAKYVGSVIAVVHLDIPGKGRNFFLCQRMHRFTPHARQWIGAVRPYRYTPTKIWYIESRASISHTVSRTNDGKQRCIMRPVRQQVAAICCAFVWFVCILLFLSCLPRLQAFHRLLQKSLGRTDQLCLYIPCLAVL